MDTDEEIVVVDTQDVAEVRLIAQAHGVDVEEVSEHGLEPFATVALVLLGSATALSTVVELVDRLKGGQVIDLRPNASKVVYRDRAARHDLIVVFATDGQVSIRIAPGRAPLSEVVGALTQSVASMRGANTNDVADFARTELGDSASVKTASDS